VLIIKGSKGTQGLVIIEMYANKVLFFTHKIQPQVSTLNDSRQDDDIYTHHIDLWTLM